MTPSADPLGIVGTVVADKYLVAEVVGEGGFSVVYRAEHLIWKQLVALKVFNVLANAPAAQREVLLEGFIQEGKLMTHLSSRSPAIVQARDVGTFTTPDGRWTPFMVLEWLDGKPLDVVLFEERRAGLPPRTVEQAMALLDAAARALELAHRQNVAHRDVKPANFMVMGEPRSVEATVKVLDFGIAKVMADHVEHATALARTGTEITSFTPNYGAPEQFSRSHGATGPWTDVFAMALVLVEMLRGGLPALSGADFVQLAVASRDPLARPTPRALGVTVSDPVEAVFRKALAISPGDRFRTMGGFWSALHEAARGGAGWTASVPQLPGLGAGGEGAGVRTDASPLGRVAEPPTTNPTVLHAGPHGAPPSPTFPEASPRAPRSSTAVAAVAAVATLALAGGLGAFFAWERGAEPEGTAAASASVVASATGPGAASAVSAASASAPGALCPSGMVLVPGGRFLMGSDDQPGSSPAHPVLLDNFCLDATEVTVKAYRACVEKGACRPPAPRVDFPKSGRLDTETHAKNLKKYSTLCNFGAPDRDAHPVNCVSHADAASYCASLGQRLPTEAEWEHAARNANGSDFPWGSEALSPGMVNGCGKECGQWEAEQGLPPSGELFDEPDGFVGTAPVGSFDKGKTRFGAHDLLGNVWEWTADWFGTYKPDEAVNPKGPPVGDRKILRGPGFNVGQKGFFKATVRFPQAATANPHAVGFRCAKGF